MDVKAIETVYNGYRFRSRLEARWAVFFDAAGIEYEYEPEGFELEDGTKYLPDFYLPEYDWYVEIKPPRKGSVEDIIRASKFVGEKIKVLLLLGNIPPKTDKDMYHYKALYKNTLTQDLTVGSVCCRCEFAAENEQYTKLEFVTCLAVDWGAHFPVFDNYGNIRLEILDAVHDRYFYDPIGDDGHSFAYCDAVLCEDDGSQQFINGCYEKARQARFEHGERGISYAKQDN